MTILLFYLLGVIVITFIALLETRCDLTTELTTTGLICICLSWIGVLAYIILKLMQLKQNYE
jgi:hypothetical protein